MRAKKKVKMDIAAAIAWKKPCTGTKTRGDISWSMQCWLDERVDNMLRW